MLKIRLQLVRKTDTHVARRCISATSAAASVKRAQSIGSPINKKVISLCSVILNQVKNRITAECDNLGHEVPLVLVFGENFIHAADWDTLDWDTLLGGGSVSFQMVLRDW